MILTVSLSRNHHLRQLVALSEHINNFENSHRCRGSIWLFYFNQGVRLNLGRKKSASAWWEELASQFVDRQSTTRADGRSWKVVLHFEDPPYRTGSSDCLSHDWLAILPTKAEADFFDPNSDDALIEV